MAQVKSLDDAECSLPSEFFNSADFPTNKGNYPRIGTVQFGFGGNLSFPNEFPYEFDSFLSSPVDSVTGSTENESSDEEELLVGLTRCLAQSSLIKTQKFGFPCFSIDQPERVKAESPQSTLSGIGCWSSKSMMSSNRRPTGPSPLTSPFDAKNYNWDPIHAALGQVARMEISVDGALYGQQDIRGFVGPLRNVAVSSLTNTSHGLYSNQVITPKHSQFQYLRVDQSDKPHSQCYASKVKEVNKVGWSVQNHQQQQIKNRGRTTVCESGRSGNPLNSTENAWPSLYDKHQKQHTQHDFLGGSGVKRECAGTGVFLPRKYNNPPDPRKNVGCRKVAIPAKTVQSPNRNFLDTKGHAQFRFVNGLLSNHETMMARKAPQLRQSLRPEPEVALNREIRLPNEWTY